MIIVTGEQDWPTNNRTPVLAASCRIRNELQKTGHEVISPDEVLSEQDTSILRTQIATIGKLMLESCTKQGMEEDRIYGLISCCLSTAYQDLATKLLMEKLGEKPAFSEDIAEFPNTTSSASPARQMHMSPILRLLCFSRPYIFDFRSDSGKKLQSSMKAVDMRISIADANEPEKLVFKHNIKQFYRHLKRRRSVKYKLLPEDISEIKQFEDENLSRELTELGGTEISSRIISTAKCYIQHFELTRLAFNNFLRQVKRKPEIAYFNVLGQLYRDGFAAALSENSVPVEFTSHGSLIAHGDDERRLITGIYSLGYYNEPPVASILLPRSPLQITRQENQSKVVRKVRLVDSARQTETRTDRAFCVYLAPNFSTWHIAMHGISPTCFEIDTCIRELAGAVRKMNDVELKLRIKTTANDKGKVITDHLSRGLLPQDFNDVYEPQCGIIDASMGSHQAHLETADLIITEGVTAVMFEALEQRKPLLLINRSRSRIPSLPSKRLTGAEPLGKRAAVYCTSAEDDLEAIIGQLREAHMNKPLTDEELAEYVWVK